MTSPTPDQPPPEHQPATARIVPGRGADQLEHIETRLAQLLALYDHAKSEFDAAEARFETLKSAIKSTAITEAYVSGQLVTDAEQQAYHGDRIIIDAPGVLSRPLVVKHAITRRVDAKALRTDLPDIAQRYTKESPSWSIQGLS